MGVPYAEVIGDPVAHSKSPLIHKFWLEKLGIKGDYRATSVAPDRLLDFLEARRTDPDWCGCNVTMPLKQAIMPLLDDLAGAAPMVEAVNTVVRSGAYSPRLVGHNTDVAGFLEPLSGWLERDTAYRTAIVIGTGGAAAAVSWGLRKHQFLLVHIARTWKSGLDFQRRQGGSDSHLVGVLSDYAVPPRLPAQWGDRDRSVDMLVNATPLGMAGQPPLLFDLSNIPPRMVVYDLVTHPPETDLLRRARALGHPVIDGLGMLVGQAAHSFGLFFGVSAPREYDAELRERLTS